MKSRVSLTSLNKATKRPTRIIYLDLLRILASFFVVLIHVLKIFWDRSATNEQFVVITMFDTVAYVAVPLFFMISGAIFLSPKLLARVKTAKLAFKYIAIYIGWTIFYVGLRAIIVQLSRQEIGLDLPTDYYADILHYHLWFLPQLIILYFLAPYIRKIINHSTRREVKNLLKLFIFGVLVRTLWGIIYEVITQQMSGNWSSIDMSLLARTTSMVSPFSESFAISAGYFMLGYYLHNFQLSSKTRVKLYTAAIVGYIFSVVLMLATQRGNLALSNFSVSILLMSAAFFVFFKQNIPQPKSAIESRALTFWAEQTLGIYLVHPIFIDLLVGKFDWPKTANFTLRAVFTAIVMYTFSFALVAVFNVSRKWVHRQIKT